MWSDRCLLTNLFDGAGGAFDLAIPARHRGEGIGLGSAAAGADHDVRAADPGAAGVAVPAEHPGVIRKGKRFSFPLWLLNLFIVCAKAVDFLRNGSAGSTRLLMEIALVSLCICIINFALGALIGGREYWQESSQALGQKNNSFVIWIALTFINPLVAMGPTFYVLYHNLYNSFQIYLFEKRNQHKIKNLE